MIASYGNLKQLPIGGGQTAARRLLATLKGLGYDVEAIHRHPPTAKSRIIRAFQFSFWLFVDPILVFFRLLFKSRKTITIYMGYLGSILIPLEFIMSWLTKTLRFKNVMYLAGGGTSRVYEKSNKFLKSLEKQILDNYQLVLVEGYDNIAFVNKLSKTKTGYLPNFTEEGFAPLSYPNKPKDAWNLFYFGRICEEKNTLLCVDTFNLLAAKYENFYFTLVGGGPEEYCRKVEKKISESAFRTHIRRYGQSSHEVLKGLLNDQHFYILPSTEPREGHSNALNEAMSYGLVPIVSDNNFLPSIVGDERLVVHQLDAESFAAVIDDIINSMDYERISIEMFKRVQTYFIQSVVQNRLKNIIDNL